MASKQRPAAVEHAIAPPQASGPRPVERAIRHEFYSLDPIGQRDRELEIIRLLQQIVEAVQEK